MAPEQTNRRRCLALAARQRLPVVVLLPQQLAQAVPLELVALTTIRLPTSSAGAMNNSLQLRQLPQRYRRVTKLSSAGSSKPIEQMQN